MKRGIFFAGLAVFFALTGGAQEIQKVSKAKDEATKEVAPDTVTKRWKISGNGTLAYSQAAFSNWAAGGQNSMGLNAIANLRATYSKGKHAWTNFLDLGYGFQLQGKMEDPDYTKTNDKLEFTSAYGYQISKNKKWYLTALVNLRTQFDNGYDYAVDSTKPISKFMAPGYLVTGIGITYTPSKWFLLFMSPASARATFVLDTALSNAGSFGVPAGDKSQWGVGPYIRADLNKDLGKSVNITSSLELYTDYVHNFGNIDVNWNALFTFKVNKWLAASLAFQVIYDDDVDIKSSPTEPAGPRTQFKEILGIGLSYMFSR